MEVEAHQPGRALEGVKEVLVQQKNLFVESQRNLERWEADRQKAQQDMDLQVRNLAADVSGAVDRLPGVFSEHAEKAADVMGKSLEQRVADCPA